MVTWVKVQEWAAIRYPVIADYLSHDQAKLWNITKPDVPCER